MWRGGRRIPWLAHAHRPPDTPILQVGEHMWNMPLQLSCPDFYDCSSRPSDADHKYVDVQEGDVLVLVRARETL